MKSVYIYTLADPITGLIRYVGKTNNPYQRYRAHTNKARKELGHKRNWINRLKFQGLKPVMEIVDVVSTNDWKFWERYWIAQIKSWGFSLVNHTDGGDGCTFGNSTSFKPGNKAKQVVAFDKDGDIKYIFSSPQQASNFLRIHRSIIPAACKGRIKVSSGYAWFYSEMFKNKTRKERERMIASRFEKTPFKLNKGCFKKGQPNFQMKKVGMYDLEWRLIRVFDSAKSAAEQVGVTGGAIQFACNRSKSKKCKNYKWKYES